ncbi:hypothetical protein, partial [Thiolapillus sp.]
ASAIKSGLPMPFTSISAGWIFTLMGLLDDGRPLNQGKSPIWYWQCQRTCVNFSKQLIVISPKLIQLWGQLSFGL